MTRNLNFYNAAAHLIMAVSFLREEDSEFCKILLDKAEEYKNKIEIDEELEKEVNEYERRIEQRM
jgi:hypothetical protein